MGSLMGFGAPIRGWPVGVPLSARPAERPNALLVWRADGALTDGQLALRFNQLPQRLLAVGVTRATPVGLSNHGELAGL